MSFREIGRYLMEREGKQVVVKVYPSVGDLDRFRTDQRKKKPLVYNVRDRFPTNKNLDAQMQDIGDDCCAILLPW